MILNNRVLFNNCKHLKVPGKVLNINARLIRFTDSVLYDHVTMSWNQCQITKKPKEIILITCLTEAYFHAYYGLKLQC